MVQVSGGNLPPTSELGPVAVASFWISRTEVTVAEHNTVVQWGQANGYDFEPSPNFRSDLPWIGHWIEAIKFCNAKSEMNGLQPVYSGFSGVIRSGKVSELFLGESILVFFDATKNGFRLCTEAEWEFAARGGTEALNTTYAGSNDVDVVAWNFNNSKGGPELTNPPTYRFYFPVAIKQPNELFLYDMSGNADEWCWDANGQQERAVRGGSFNSDLLMNPNRLRVETRHFEWPFARLGAPKVAGIRLARNIDE